MLTLGIVESTCWPSPTPPPPLPCPFAIHLDSDLSFAPCSLISSTFPTRLRSRGSRLRFAATHFCDKWMFSNKTSWRVEATLSLSTFQFRHPSHCFTVARYSSHSTNTCQCTNTLLETNALLGEERGNTEGKQTCTMPRKDEILRTLCMANRNVFTLASPCANVGSHEMLENTWSQCALDVRHCIPPLARLSHKVERFSLMLGQTGSSSWRPLPAVAKQDCRVTFPFLLEIQQTPNSDLHSHRLFLDLSRRSAQPLFQ